MYSGSILRGRVGSMVDHMRGNRRPGGGDGDFRRGPFSSPLLQMATRGWGGINPAGPGSTSPPTGRRRELPFVSWPDPLRAERNSYTSSISASGWPSQNPSAQVEASGQSRQFLGHAPDGRIFDVWLSAQRLNSGTPSRANQTGRVTATVTESNTSSNHPSETREVIARTVIEDFSQPIRLRSATSRLNYRRPLWLQLDYEGEKSSKPFIWEGTEVFRATMNTV